MKAKSFIGTLYAGLLDADKKLVGGYRRLGNAYPFSMQVATENKSQMSRLRESGGQTLHTKTTISGTTGSLTLREWDPKNLAWALSGEEAALVGAGGDVAAESITFVMGEYVKLAHRNVSAVVVTGSVSGQDYVVNAGLGMIKAVVGGNLTAGAKPVAYTWAAETGYKVEIGTKAQIRVALMLDGEDEYDGESISGEWDSVVLASSAEINFISDPGTEYEELPFTLNFETLEGKSSPGRINGISI